MAQRGMAVSFAGRAYVSREVVPKGERMPNLGKLKEFWEWRLSETSSTEELQEFGWWATQNKFETQWFLERLIETLDKTNGVVEAAFRVIDALDAIAKDYPLPCIKALDLIIRCRNNKGIFFHAQNDKMRNILSNAYQSGNPDALKIADRLLDHVAKLGFEDFRFVRNRNANTQSPPMRSKKGRKELKQKQYDKTTQIHIGV